MMVILIRSIHFVLLLFVMSSTPVAADKSQQHLSDNDKINYSVGFKIGKDLKRQEIEVKKQQLLKGIEDAIRGESLLTPQQRNRALMTLQQRAIEARQSALKKQAEDNLKKGKDFLTENSNRDGVITLANGLQYREVRVGTGRSPAVSDSVTVNYRGTLIDGKEFDSSLKHNKPATFKVNRVIRGWTEALQLMQVGDRWELYIPPQLAYGERSMSQSIPPNSTLIFELELLSVN